MMEHTKDRCNTEDDTEVVIRVCNVSKMYRIYENPQDRLKQMFSWRFGKTYGQEFWALQNVSLEVRKGETVGIVGRNGSGKSTLLQIIAGTLAPTTGTVEVQGRVAALLELGSGFNPEFTGRENVYLNGSILGISEEEMNGRFDEIIDFADIGDFIEQPVKIYSSGMIVRLAFAVQACIVPDILIVDEALAVGDMYFQTKCMAKIAELRKRGTSILFVSHSLGTVKAICSWAALLDNGQVILSGHPDPVGDKYVSIVMQERHRNASPTSNFVEEEGREHRSLMQPPFLSRVTERFGTGIARYVECKIFQGDREVASVDHGEICQVQALLHYNDDVNEWGEVGIVVRTIDGLDLFAANSFLLREIYPPQRANTLVKVTFSFQAIMAAGVYSVALGYRVPVQGEYIDKVYNAVAFTVEVTDGMPVPFMFSNPSKFEYEVIEVISKESSDVIA